MRIRIQQMHIVTYNREKYNNLGEAVGKDGGIAVIGVFFKVWCRHLGNETELHGYGAATFRKHSRNFHCAVTSTAWHTCVWEKAHFVFKKAVREGWDYCQN